MPGELCIYQILFISIYRIIYQNEVRKSES